MCISHKITFIAIYLRHGCLEMLRKNNWIVLASFSDEGSETHGR